MTCRGTCQKVWVLCGDASGPLTGGLTKMEILVREVLDLAAVGRGGLKYQLIFTG